MMSRGHWRDVGDGLALVRRSRPLFMVLVVWSVAIVGNAFFNVAEIFFAKDVLDSGDLGFGILVGATGLGLTVGGFFGGRWIDRFGVTRVYVASLALWGAGVAAAAVSPWLALAAALVAVGLVGNGVAVVCNLLLVQRGAPDHLRGRAFTVIMSVNYLHARPRHGCGRPAHRRDRRALDVGRSRRDVRPWPRCSRSSSRVASCSRRQRRRVEPSPASSI